MEGTDTVAHAGDILVGEPLSCDRLTVHRPGHDDKRAMAALGGTLTKVLVEVE